MGTGGMVAQYAFLLDVNAYMVFFLFDEHVKSFDEHAARLYAALKQPLYIGCVKWSTF